MTLPALFSPDEWRWLQGAPLILQAEMTRLRNDRRWLLERLKERHHKKRRRAEFQQRLAVTTHALLMLENQLKAG